MNRLRYQPVNPPYLQSSTEPSTHLVPGVHTCIRPLSSGSHEVCNVARPVQDGSAELVLSEITGFCEAIERGMKGGGNLDWG